MNNNFIIPLSQVSAQDRTKLRLAWLVLGCLIWLMFKPMVMPDPIQIISTLPRLWSEQGLSNAIVTSLLTNMNALGISIIISASLAFGRKIPAISPVSDGLAYLRFLTPACFFALLLFTFKTGHAAKLGMMVLGESFFLTAALNKIVDSIPNEVYDEAKVLRMNTWQQLYYVTIRGRLDSCIDAVQDVAAMGWAMLPMVEGAIRSEGGVGVLTLNQERYLNFDAVYGIALVVLLVGIGQDWLIRCGKELACPHTKL